ncbi:MAG TPA: hypothetical protein PLP58_14300, partial [Prosthecobacter sp.]|nr:hypothetical protein [Prosthecobacter sp.]
HRHRLHHLRHALARHPLPGAVRVSSRAASTGASSSVVRSSNIGAVAKAASRCSTAPVIPSTRRCSPPARAENPAQKSAGISGRPATSTSPPAARATRTRSTPEESTLQRASRPSGSSA